MAGDINKSVNVAINVINGVSKQVNTIAASFDKLSGNAKRSTVAISDLNKALGNLKIPSGISKLTKDLNKLSKIKSDDIGNVASSMEKLKDIKFPELTKINSDLEKHIDVIKKVIKAYGDLSKASKNINLKTLSSETKSGSKAVKSLSDETKKSKVSFSQWGFALGSASTGLSKFGTQIYGVTRGFSAVSKEMNVAMVAFTSAFSAMFALKGIVSDIVEFDDAIRAAGAVAQASATEFDMLSDAARRMGETTRYTATDAAEALKALAMTGLDVGESIETLPTVLNLAAAANMDLGKSADIVTNIMVGYGKTVEELPRIADLMTAAFTNANTSLEQIGVAMQYVGPVANAAGMSIEETTGILASLANAGYRGSKAGTTLRTSIARLLAPTEKIRNALHNYGIEMKDLTEEGGSLKSFTDILSIMEEKGVSAGDALIIFGKRAGPGIQSLITQGSEAIEEMNRKIVESESLSLAVAYEMEAGLGGALRRLRSMWQELSLTIGKMIESDVQSYIEALTKTLQENKTEIANFVKSLLDIIGAFAKVAGWFAQLAANNIKLVGSISLLATALGLITTATKLLQSAGLAKIFLQLNSVKWAAATIGINGIATATTAYAEAQTVANAAIVKSKMAEFFKSLTTFSGIKAILTGAASGITAFASSLATAIGTMAAANPVIAALVAVIGTATAVSLALDKNYVEMADSAQSAADSTAQLNEKVEYQIAKLALLNRQFDNDNIDDHSKSQEELVNLILDGNIGLDEKIRLMKLVKSGTEGSKEAIDQMNKSLLEEEKRNNINELKERAKARDLNSKAIRKQALETQRLFGYTVDGSQEAETAMEGFVRGWVEIGTLGGYANKLMGANLEEYVKYYETLDQNQKGFESGLAKTVKKLVESGVSIQDITSSLAQAGASSDTIDKVTQAFDQLTEATDDSTESSKKRNQYTTAEIEGFKALTEEIIRGVKEGGKQREAALEKTLQNIAIMEAKGEITHDHAEAAKLQASLNSYQSQVDAAKQAYDAIHEADVDGKDKALALIISSEKKAAAERNKILKNIISEEEAMNKKLVSSNEKKVKEKQRHEQSLNKIMYGLNEKEIGQETLKNKKIKEINEKLKKDLAEIDEAISKKREEFAKERLDLERQTNQNIKSINSSTEDKIREIRQRGMTDAQKDASNRQAANKKLQEGISLINKARSDGDSAAFDRGKSLISQAESLYSGLQNQSAAISGVKSAGQALEKAEQVRYELANKAIDEKQKKEETAAAKEKKNLEDAAAKEKKKESDAYDTKIKNENSVHKLKMDNINKQISQYEGKLNKIREEKQLVIDLIEAQKDFAFTDEMKNQWDESYEATQKAVRGTEDFAKALEKIDDTELNTKFTGENSPRKPLSETIKDVKDSLSELGKFEDVYFNIKFVGENNNPLSEEIKNIDSEISSLIESVDISIPMDIESEKLYEVNKVIDNLRETGVQLNVEVERSQLDSLKLMIDSIMQMPITVTATVKGYSDVLMLKELIDKLKSKTIYITTVQKTVEERAAGGFIGSPQYYDSGGSVFNRLSSRFISSGSGNKDDVPAMLMKGEFVQRASAVKKYGVKFMSMLNRGLIPLELTKNMISKFANGGVVNTSSMNTILGQNDFARNDNVVRLDNFGKVTLSTGALQVPAVVSKDTVVDLESTLSKIKRFSS